MGLHGPFLFRIVTGQKAKNRKSPQYILVHVMFCNAERETLKLQEMLLRKLE
jgi:hypothetical protein